ncbi:HPF/RaiA family ribosome-associated protein [Micromonospora rifamycinica]|uniref:Sigma 54 modulation protein / S30EA ribosomal protein n=1 Tax=Micromonospora rifamycinica TaxID=291594 RepID=A0A109IFV2_9ACTN|nr:HPF/RaiA family ribosome-associated protein [Micromonospora rifamycinica]KWV29763.1 Fis family transcriptional regulator [Micromonospora rifamycinica]SCG80256.1 Sigma 54 modulation protein / S30EA ribosomal protein [Micromonospora rifamycinica]
MSAVANPATVAECLRMGAGFSQGDRNWIVEQFGTLDARLAAFHADATELEVSVKDREARGQKVTLECWIAGRQKIVTTSSEEDLRAALNDARDDLRRKLNDSKTRQEPRHNKHIREMAAPPVPAPLPDLDSDNDADRVDAETA